GGRSGEEARGRGDPARRAEAPGKQGEGTGREADHDEQRNRLAAFGQAAEMIEGLRAAGGRREAALGGEDGEGEKRRAGADEAEDQKRGRQRILRPGQREGEGHTAVAQRIEDEVEETGEAGGVGSARRR